MSYDIREDYSAEPPEVDGVALPTKMEVCPACRGKGTHVNPSIDSNGISAEAFAEDPDFAEDYFSGVYDVVCYVCHGRNVVPVVDEDACDPELLAAYNEQQEAYWDYRAEVAAERRMGC